MVQTMRDGAIESYLHTFVSARLAYNWQSLPLFHATIYTALCKVCFIEGQN